MNTDALLRLLQAFAAQDVKYALIGAAALSLHGIVRATEDVDVIIEASEENVERLKQALRAVYADPHIDEIAAEDLLGEYPAVRYYPPDGDLYLDILTRLGQMAAYPDLEIEEREIEGIRVRLASARCLHRLKRDTVRPLDRADALALEQRFGLAAEDDD